MAFDHERMGRIGGLATIDIVGTAVIAAIVGWAIARARKRPVIPVVLFVIFFAFVLGEFVHLALGIRTPIVGA